MSVAETLPWEKAISLSRTKKTPQARHDLNIFRPIKWEERSAMSLDRIVQSIPVQFSRPLSQPISVIVKEEDSTDNTGDSGISEWIGMLACM